MSAYTLFDVALAAAERGPSAPAVRLGDVRWNYGELLGRARQIGAALRREGIQKGDRVALFQPKSLDGVASLLGIMECGTAYVPIDPQAPPDRARFVWDHAGAKALFAAGRPLKLAVKAGVPFPGVVFAGDDTEISGGKTLRMNALPPADGPAPKVSDQELAYILYTSGSTGTPKGVAITHAQSMAFVRPAAQVFALTSSDVLASHAPFNFDLSVIDLYCAFLASAEVALIAETWLGFPVKIGEYLEKAKITVWNSVPSALIQLATHGQLGGRDLSQLRLIMFAGEPYPPKHLRTLHALVPKAALLNIYGQTEANSSTYYFIHSIPEDDAAPISIGKTFPNYDILVLGDDQKPITDAGKEGELYVIGNAVASGYWADPERTAKAFVQHPLENERRRIVYKTGDRVTFDKNGDLYFKGRADFAIKCRGFRVEPQEIEAHAAAQPGVAEVAVIPVPHEEAGNLLVLFLVAEAGKTIDVPALRGALAEKLPKYMLPEAVVVKPVLPRGPTGKVDRKVLVEEAKGQLTPS